MQLLTMAAIVMFLSLTMACSNSDDPQIGILPTPDLYVADIEVSQGTQNLTNDLPLVANRWTIVRVYIKDNNQRGANGVSARLLGFRQCPGPGCPPNVIGQHSLPTLTPWNNSKGSLVNIKADGGSRVNLNDSFWFHLPESWRKFAGNLHIVAEVNPDGNISETQNSNNTKAVDVTFYPADTMRLRAVPLHLHQGWDKNNPEVLYGCNEPGFWRVMFNMFRYHPAAELQVACLDEPLEPFPHEIATIDIQPFEWDMSDETICGDAHTRLKWLKALENFSGRWHYVGMISNTIGNLCNGWAGAANGDAVWLKMSDLVFDNAYPWQISRGQTLAHEIGHSRLPNPDHILCKGNEGPPNGSADTQYPFLFPNCRFSASNGRGFYGLDVYYPLWFSDVPQPTVLPNGDADAFSSPSPIFPLMGYIRPRWTEPYSYCEFLNTYVTTPGFFCDRDSIDVNTGGVLTKLLLPKTATTPPAPLLPSASEYLLVSGMVNIADGDGRIMQTALQPAVDIFQHVFDEAEQKLQDQVTTGSIDPYALEVRDASGAVLYSVPVMLDAGNMEPGNLNKRWSAFIELLPFDATAVTVALVDTDKSTTIKTRSRSANAPTVVITALSTGNTLNSGSTISWASSDNDAADVLHYTVRYSPDAGTSWYVVALDHHDPTLVLQSIDGLPGSNNGQIQVMVNDGFNTAETVLTGLTVPAKAPQVVISSPPAGQVFSTNNPVLLTAFAQDVEDGVIDPVAIVWTSNQQSGSLGIGGELILKPENMKPGLHIITASVIDNDGMTGEDSIDISFALAQ